MKVFLIIKDIMFLRKAMRYYVETDVEAGLELMRKKFTFFHRDQSFRFLLLSVFRRERTSISDSR